MKINLIDYGYKNAPKRAHHNDAGADVYSTIDYTLEPFETHRIPLGFGLNLPDGLVAFIMPRSSLSSKGISCEMAPIDSGYTGEVHAIIVNNTKEPYTISEDDRVGQLVVFPTIIASFETIEQPERGNNAFGSTGK